MPGPDESGGGRGLVRMGAGPQALTDSPTARPGRSLRSRSGGREGGGAGFPAGGAEPVLEKEEKEEKGGKGVSWSHRPECQGPSRASQTPGGAAGRGETAGPARGVSTFEGGHKLTFLSGSAGAFVSLLLPSSSRLCSVLPHQSLRRLALPVAPAALFPGSAWVGLGWGIARRWTGIPGGGGASPTPSTTSGVLLLCRLRARAGVPSGLGLGRSRSKETPARAPGLHGSHATGLGQQIPGH